MNDLRRPVVLVYLSLGAALYLSCAGHRPPAAVPPPQPPAPSPWAESDSRALAAPPSVETSVQALAAYLTEGLPGEEEKIRAIFRWVTGHIQYDLKGLREGNYGDLSPEGVLRRRSAVCEGYSGLFEALVKQAGFEVVTITGYAKGVGYSAGDPVPTTFNHSWNAVKTGSGWRLVDCTWGAGALDQQDEYVKGFDPFYFFTPPAQFIFSHYPDDPAWQLLPAALGRADFEALPLVKPAYFDCGISFEGTLTGLLIVPESPAAFRFKVPRDVALNATALRGEAPLDGSRVRITREGDSATVEVLFPDPGIYVLRLFAAKGLESNPLYWALDLRVAAEKGSGARTFETMSDKKDTKKRGSPAK